MEDYVKYHTFESIDSYYSISKKVEESMTLEIASYIKEKEAGIKNSDILIAIMGSDELNMLTCLMAKKMGDCRTIARVRKPENTRSIHVIKDELGLAMIINPEQTAAKEMAKVLRFPTAIITQ